LPATKASVLAPRFGVRVYVHVRVYVCVCMCVCVYVCVCLLSHLMLLCVRTCMEDCMYAMHL
jgi:hypothetical protein